MGAELVAFLRARLAEDEVRARAASAGPWWLVHNHFEGDNVVQIRSAPTEADSLHGQWSLVARLSAMPDTAVTRGRMAADSVYLEASSPVARLADIASKRAVIDVCEKVVTAGVGGVPGAEPSRRERRHVTDILRALAQVYARHPQFRPEWQDVEEQQDAAAANGITLSG